MDKEQHVNLEPVSPERRSFLQAGLKVLGAVAVLEMGAAGFLFLRARSLEGRYGGVMTLGAVNDFTPGSVVEFEEGNFFLIRTLDGGFLAISRRCPHLGCTVNWVAQKEKFYCPCHAASFDQYGEYHSNLVSRAMDIYAISFEDGMVKVDTSNVQQRKHHLPEHISYNS